MSEEQLLEVRIESQDPALIVSITFFGSVVPALAAACDHTWNAA